MMEWISVEDRLPKVSRNAKDFQLASGESDRVLIFMNGYEHIGTYHVNINEWAIHFHGIQWLEANPLDAHASTTKKVTWHDLTLPAINLYTIGKCNK